MLDYYRSPRAGESSTAPDRARRNAARQRSPDASAGSPHAIVVTNPAHVRGRLAHVSARARRPAACLTLCFAAFLGCKQKPAAPPSAPVTADGPRLLVLVAIDQFPYEYLARFDAYFTGGLRRLLDQGVLFENARYGHAVTVTAAGHTTLASGLHPSSSGIIDNYWFDRTKRKRSTASTTPSTSAARRRTCSAPLSPTGSRADPTPAPASTR